MEVIKEKNLLDLEYNTYLNYFNIITLAIITTYVAVVIVTLDKIQWNASRIILTALSTFILIIVIWFIFYSKFESIKLKLQNLKI
ncbi:hypothetical protein HYV49_04720 [Candidatus Pacearchaeota archaeon]|nr:hypothetical protein [Candidatus Pacearchaeota archaeon]